MNRYQLCAKYGWAFSSNMRDRYIERKGIIFDQIAEKGDTDQVTMLQKENRQLMEKVEKLDGEYKRVREKKPLKISQSLKSRFALSKETLDVLHKIVVNLPGKF